MFAQLLRFVGVGGLATAAHVLTAIATQAMLPVSAQQANLAGFGAGLLVSYVGHTAVTFGASFRSGPQFLRFVVLSLAGLGVSSLTVHVVTTQLGLGFIAAMACVAVLVPGFTYLAMRFWVFDRQGQQTGLSLAEIGLPALLALLLLALFWGRISNHDVAWYLFATRDWLDGQRLYIDIMEVNPPLAFYLTIPALAIADTLATSDANGHYILVALLLFGSLLWSAHLLRADSGLTRGQRSLFVLGAAVAIILPALNGIGQREQLLVMAMLPWALVEASVKPRHGREVLASAVLAAVGMCLKPHFILFPIAVTVLNCIEQRSLRPVLSLANWVFLLTGLAYVGLVWLVHPAYLTDIVPMAMLVYDAYGKPWDEILLRVDSALLPVALLAVMLWRQDRMTRELRVFLTLAVAGVAVYFLQGKGFSYHALPLVAFAAMACLLILLRRAAGRTVLLLSAFTLALTAIDGLKQGFYTNYVIPATLRAVIGQGNIDGMTALSSHVYLGAPVAMALQTDWASHYPANWLVPGAINHLAQTDCTAKPATCERLRQIASRNRAANIADILRMKPDLLIVDRNSGYFDQPGFDWLAFMAEDPAWAPVFADYREIGRNGRVTYFLRSP